MGLYKIKRKTIFLRNEDSQVEKNVLSIKSSHQLRIKNP